MCRYLHEEVILHLASEKYIASDWKNEWVHITNHVKQRDHPRYSRERNTWKWTKFLAYLNGGYVYDDGTMHDTQVLDGCDGEPERVGERHDFDGDEGFTFEEGDTFGRHVFNRMCEIVRDTFRAFKRHKTLFFPIPGK